MRNSNGIVTVQIPLTEKDYRTIIRAKGDQTWPEFLLNKSNGGNKR